MADPHWTSYVGMITGIIGSLTGVLGAILGFIGYRKASDLKSLDLRIEVHKTRNDVHVSGVQMIDLLEEARSSRTAVAAAMGKSHSGGQKSFEQKFEADRDHARELVSQIPNPDLDLSKLSVGELVELHRLQGWSDDLTQHYEGTLAEDEEDRRHIRGVMTRQ